MIPDLPVEDGMENSKEQRHRDRRLKAARRNSADRRATERETTERRTESLQRFENERRADNSRNHQGVNTD